MRATVTNAWSIPGSPAPIQFHSGYAQDGSDGACGPALLANHLAQFARGYAQFQGRGVVAMVRHDADLIRRVHQRLGYRFNHFAHVAAVAFGHF